MPSKKAKTAEAKLTSACVAPCLVFKGKKAVAVPSTQAEGTHHGSKKHSSSTDDEGITPAPPLKKAQVSKDKGKKFVKPKDKPQPIFQSGIIPLTLK